MSSSGVFCLPPKRKDILASCVPPVLYPLTGLLRRACARNTTTAKQSCCCALLLLCQKRPNAGFSTRSRVNAWLAAMNQARRSLLARLLTSHATLPPLFLSLRLALFLRLALSLARSHSLTHHTFPNRASLHLSQVRSLNQT